jgi:plasmid stability protein
MQYTLRNIPQKLDKALRQRARLERKSLNQILIDLLRQAVGIGAEPVKKRDLSEIAGSWVEDPEFDRAMEEFERIHPDEWK